MAEKNNVKLKFRVSHGSPVNGSIIRAGAVVELPEFWANKFVKDGVAELVGKPEKAEKPAAKPEKAEKPAAKPEKAEKAK